MTTERKHVLMDTADYCGYCLESWPCYEALLEKNRAKRECKFLDCNRTSRALGYCDTHYRQFKYGGGLHEIGSVGRAPLDSTVWKIRIRNERGSQPFYFSNEEQAHARADKAAKDGTLVFFAKYEFKEQIV